VPTTPNRETIGILNMDEYTFSVHICDNQREMEATQEAFGVVMQGLTDNIVKRIGNIPFGISIRIFLRNPRDRVVGGITGEIFGGWLYTSMLWVEESLRHRGYGTRLLSMLEKEAIQRGCRHAHVDTFSFEARPFYEKLGYTLFGTLEDYPEGYCKYFLKKDLL
jgi:GNAT superfamily N-acetyltransferase